MPLASTLCPLVLKSSHSLPEAEVARLFQVGGLAALLAHAFVTPWISSRPWRHLAVQAMAVVNVGLLLGYAFLGERHASVAGRTFNSIIDVCDAKHFKVLDALMISVPYFEVF